MITERSCEESSGLDRYNKLCVDFRRRDRRLLDDMGVGNARYKWAEYEAYLLKPFNASSRFSTGPSLTQNLELATVLAMDRRADCEEYDTRL